MAGVVPCPLGPGGVDGPRCWRLGWLARVREEAAGLSRAARAARDPDDRRLLRGMDRELRAAWEQLVDAATIDQDVDALCRLCGIRAEEAPALAHRLRGASWERAAERGGLGAGATAVGRLRRAAQALSAWAVAWPAGWGADCASARGRVEDAFSHPQGGAGAPAGGDARTPAVVGAGRGEAPTAGVDRGGRRTPAVSEALASGGERVPAERMARGVPMVVAEAAGRAPAGRAGVRADPAGATVPVPREASAGLPPMSSGAAGPRPAVPGGSAAPACTGVAPPTAASGHVPAGPHGQSPAPSAEEGWTFFVPGGRTGAVMRRLRLALRPAAWGRSPGGVPGAGDPWELRPALDAAAPGGYAELRAPVPLATVWHFLRRMGCRPLLPDGGTDPTAGWGRRGRSRRRATVGRDRRRPV